MSDTTRDTQFLKFAQAVSEEIDDMAVSFSSYPGHDVLKQLEVKIIARRAYDLMAHVIDHAPASVSGADDWHIPDMTTLPEANSTVTPDADNTELHPLDSSDK